MSPMRCRALVASVCPSPAVCPALPSFLLRLTAHVSWAQDGSCKGHAACWGFGRNSRGCRGMTGPSWGRPSPALPDTAQSLLLISPSFFPCPKHSWPRPSCSRGIQLLICKPKGSSQRTRGPVLDTEEHRRMLGAELNPLTRVK